MYSTPQKDLKLIGLVAASTLFTLVIFGQFFTSTSCHAAVLDQHNNNDFIWFAREKIQVYNTSYLRTNQCTYTYAIYKYQVASSLTFTDFMQLKAYRSDLRKAWCNLITNLITKCATHIWSVAFLSITMIYTENRS